MNVPLGYELKRAQQALSQVMQRALAELDLTLPEYAALWALDEAPGLSSAELARRSFVTAQTMNDVVLGLERKGLLTRRAHPQHGRIRPAELTAAGRSKLANARRRVERLEDRMVVSLTPAQRRDLAGWLRACWANLEGRELSAARRRPSG
jgi:DNA-binding MarR family transcriptional regulator